MFISVNNSLAQLTTKTRSGGKNRVNDEYVPDNNIDTREPWRSIVNHTIKDPCITNENLEYVSVLVQLVLYGDWSTYWTPHTVQLFVLLSKLMKYSVLINHAIFKSIMRSTKPVCMHNSRNTASNFLVKPEVFRKCIFQFTVPASIYKRQLAKCCVLESIRNHKHMKKGTHLGLPWRTHASARTISQS